MFAVATRNFVEEVDHGGCLIPVRSPNDSISALTVVVKRKRFWFWQRAKYRPTDFTLNDLLSGDPPINPVLAESDFIKYSGTFGDNIQGNVDATFVSSGVNLEGKDCSKLQSVFGSLKKEEVDVQRLLRDSKNRMLDMGHTLIQQTKEKHRLVFGIVKERIVTTQPCSVIEEVQQGGQCGGSLAPCGPTNSKVSLKENGSLSKDSNITMEIPTHTTIAYGLIELEVKHDGHFDLCLMSETTGGFETDGPVSICAASQRSSDNSVLHKELGQLSDHFLQLSTLPAATRSLLLQQITELMEDRESIGALLHVLSQMLEDCTPESVDFLSEARQQNIKAVLDLLEQSGEVMPAGSSQCAPLLTALHLMSSALEEMKGDSLADLRECCVPKVLHMLELLVECVCGSGEMPLSKADVNTDTWQRAERLFAWADVSLKQEGNMITTVSNHQAGNRRLVLCLTIRSLASLAHGL